MRVLLHLLLIGQVMLAIGQARVLAQPAPAADKTKVATQYVDAGLAAQSTGDYDTALTMYSKAYQLVPHPLLVSLGASALVATTEVAFAVYSFSQLNAQLRPGQLPLVGEPGASVSTGNCGKSYQTSSTTAIPK